MTVKSLIEMEKSLLALLHAIDRNDATDVIDAGAKIRLLATQVEIMAQSLDDAELGDHVRNTVQELTKLVTTIQAKIAVVLSAQDH